MGVAWLRLWFRARELLTKISGRLIVNLYYCINARTAPGIGKCGKPWRVRATPPAPLSTRRRCGPPARAPPPPPRAAAQTPRWRRSYTSSRTMDTNWPSPQVIVFNRVSKFKSNEGLGRFHNHIEGTFNLHQLTVNIDACLS